MGQDSGAAELELGLEDPHVWREGARVMVDGPGIKDVAVVVDGQVAVPLVRVRERGGRGQCEDGNDALHVSSLFLPQRGERRWS